MDCTGNMIDGTGCGMCRKCTKELLLLIYKLQNSESCHLGFEWKYHEEMCQTHGPDCIHQQAKQLLDKNKLKATWAGTTPSKPVDHAHENYRNTVGL